MASASAIFDPDPAKTNSAPLQATPVEVLGLPTRVRQALIRAHIETIEELIEHTETEVWAIHNVGIGSVSLIKKALDDEGLQLKPADTSTSALENDLAILPEDASQLLESTVLDQEIPIEVLHLSARPYNALRTHGIRTLQELVPSSEKDILAIRGLGKGTLNEIRTALQKFELALGQPVALSPTLQSVAIEWRKRLIASGRLIPRLEETSLDQIVSLWFRPLSGNGKTVLGYRYGLHASPHSVEETAHTLSYTPAEIIRIEQRALQKLGCKDDAETAARLAEVVLATLHHAGGPVHEELLGQAVAAACRPQKISPVGVARIVLDTCDQAVRIPGEDTWGGIFHPLLVVPQLRAELGHLLDRTLFPAPLEHLVGYLEQFIEQSALNEEVSQEFVVACIRADPRVEVDEHQLCRLRPSGGILGGLFQQPTLDLLMHAWLETVGDRAQEVVRCRYGFDDGRIDTLEACGQRLGVTRERVRQIQKRCVKMLAHPSRYCAVREAIKVLANGLRLAGGLMLENDLGQHLAATYRAEKTDPTAAARLIMSISKEFTQLPKEDTWALSEVPVADVSTIRGVARQVLHDYAAPMALSDLIRRVRDTDTVGQHDAVANTFLRACIQTDPNLFIDEKGQCGLKRWQKSRLDEIMSVFRELGRPTHYTEIAERVNELMPPDLRASVHTIHAELGRRTDLFVRVGHGVFGLPEWGLADDGSVANAAYRVLSQTGHPLHIDEITDQVLETWHVARPSIHAAVLIDDRFYRAATATFGLVEWEVERLGTVQPVLNVCPPLVLDRPGERNTFFESVLVARDLLHNQPTTAAFLTEMFKSVSADLEPSERSYQDVLNAYYIVGLIPYTFYRYTANAVLHSTLPEISELQVLRRYCLGCVMERLAGMPEFLGLISARQPCTRSELGNWFYGPNLPSDGDIKQRIRLLHNFGILEAAEGHYHLTPLGASISQDLGAVCPEEHQDTEDPTSQLGESQLVWDAGFDAIDFDLA